MLILHIYNLVFVEFRVKVFETYCNIRKNAHIKQFNFINVKRTNFLYERGFGSFYYVHVTRKKLPKWRSYRKHECLMLMKLTAGCLRSTYFIVWEKSESFKQDFQGWKMIIGERRDTWGRFRQCFRRSFYVRRSQKHKERQSCC